MRSNVIESCQFDNSQLNTVLNDPLELQLLLSHRLDETESSKIEMLGTIVGSLYPNNDYILTIGQVRNSLNTWLESQGSHIYITNENVKDIIEILAKKRIVLVDNCENEKGESLGFDDMWKDRLGTNMLMKRYFDMYQKEENAFQRHQSSSVVDTFIDICNEFSTATSSFVSYFKKIVGDHPSRRCDDSDCASGYLEPEQTTNCHSSKIPQPNLFKLTCDHVFLHHHLNRSDTNSIVFDQSQKVILMENLKKLSERFLSRNNRSYSVDQSKDHDNVSRILCTEKSDNQSEYICLLDYVKEFLMEQLNYSTMMNPMLHSTDTSHPLFSANPPTCDNIASRHLDIDERHRSIEDIHYHLNVFTWYLTYIKMKAIPFVTSISSISYSTDGNRDAASDSDIIKALIFKCGTESYRTASRSAVDGSCFVRDVDECTIVETHIENYFNRKIAEYQSEVCEADRRLRQELVRGDRSRGSKVLLAKKKMYQKLITNLEISLDRIQEVRHLRESTLTSKVIESVIARSLSVTRSHRDDYDIKGLESVIDSMKANDVEIYENQESLMNIISSMHVDSDDKALDEELKSLLLEIASEDEASLKGAAVCLPNSSTEINMNSSVTTETEEMTQGSHTTVVDSVSNADQTTSTANQTASTTELIDCKADSASAATSFDEQLQAIDAAPSPPDFELPNLTGQSDTPKKYVASNNPILTPCDV